MKNKQTIFYISQLKNGLSWSAMFVSINSKPDNNNNEKTFQSIQFTDNSNLVRLNTNSQQAGAIVFDQLQRDSLYSLFALTIVMLLFC